MLTVDSHDEAALRLLILNPEREGDVSAAAREAARRIRRFFMVERRWTQAQLIPWRFRDLAALTEPGQVQLCRTAGRVDWARQQDDDVLGLALNELRALRGRPHGAHLNRLTGDKVAATVLVEKTVALSKEDWTYLERLVRERMGRIDQKSRTSGAQLGEGLKVLLEDAYGR